MAHFFHSPIVKHSTTFGKEKHACLYELGWQRRRFGAVGLLVALLAMGGLASCTKTGGGMAELPPTFVLERFADLAVVRAVYTQAWAKPERDSGLVAVLRGGDVVELAGRSEAKVRFEGALDYWYTISTSAGVAWVHGGALLPVPSRASANLQAKLLREELFP